MRARPPPPRSHHVHDRTDRTATPPSGAAATALDAVGPPAAYTCPPTLPLLLDARRLDGRVLPMPLKESLTMPTPKGYQPTTAERQAHRERGQRLYRARRADPALGLPADARQLQRRAALFARRLAGNPLSNIHPADALVINDALALALNEVTVVASILNSQSRSTP